MPCSWIKTHNTTKVLIFSVYIYGTMNSNEKLSSYLCRNWQGDSKIKRQSIEPRITLILKEDNLHCFISRITIKLQLSKHCGIGVKTDI